MSDMDDVSGPPRKKQKVEDAVESSSTLSPPSRRELSDLLEPCYEWVRASVYSYPSYHISWDREKKALREALSRLESLVEESCQPLSLDILEFLTDKIVAIQHLSGHYRKRETFDSCIFPQESWDKLGELWTSAVVKKTLSVEGFYHLTEAESHKLLALKLEGVLYEGRGAFVAAELECWKRYWETILLQKEVDIIAAALESFCETRPCEVLGLKETLQSAGLAIAITQGQGGNFKPATGALCLLQLLQKVRMGTHEGGSLNRALDVCRKEMHKALCCVLSWPKKMPGTGSVNAGSQDAVKGGTRVLPLDAQPAAVTPAAMDEVLEADDSHKLRAGTLADLAEAFIARTVLNLDESVLSKGKVVDSVVEVTQGSRRIVAHCIAYEMQENPSQWTPEDAFLLAQSMANCGFSEAAFQAGLAAFKAIKRWPPPGALHWVVIQSQMPGLHDPRARLGLILDLLKPGNVTGNEMVRTVHQLSREGRTEVARELAGLFIAKGWPRDVDVLFDSTYVRGMDIILDAWLAGEDDRGVLERVNAVTQSGASIRCWLDVAKRMEATGRHDCMFRLCAETALSVGLREPGLSVVYWAGLDWILNKAVTLLNTDLASKLVQWMEEQILNDDECGGDLIRNANRLARAAVLGLGNVKIWRQLAVRVLEAAHEQIDLSVHWWREALSVWRLLGPSTVRKLVVIVEKKGPEIWDEALSLARVCSEQDGFPRVVSAAWRRALRLLFRVAKQSAGSTAVYHLDAAMDALEERIDTRVCQTAHTTQRVKDKCCECQLQRGDVREGLKLAEAACKAWKQNGRYLAMKHLAEKMGW